MFSHSVKRSQRGQHGYHRKPGGELCFYLHNITHNQIWNFFTNHHGKHVVGITLKHRFFFGLTYLWKLLWPEILLYINNYITCIFQNWLKTQTFSKVYYIFVIDFTHLSDKWHLFNFVQQDGQNWSYACLNMFRKYFYE